MLDNEMLIVFVLTFLHLWLAFVSFVFPASVLKACSYR